MLCISSALRCFFICGVFFDLLIIGRPFLCKSGPQNSIYRSVVARCLNFLQKLCIYPIDRTLALCIRRYRKKKDRVGYFASFFILIACAPVSLPLAFIGVIIRAILQPFRSRMLFRERSVNIVEGESALDGDVRYKICSLNIAMSEFDAMNAAFQVGPSSFRVNDVLFTVLRHNPDVVCLQEVFDPECVEVLSRAFAAKGFNVVAHTDSAFGMGISSGLLVATKYWPETLHFQKFASAKGMEILAKKGFLSLEHRIRTDLHSSACSFQIVCTHLQAGSTSLELCQARFAQLREIETFLEQKSKDNDDREENGHRCDILVGDFNMFFDKNIEPKDCSVSSDYNHFFVDQHNERCLKGFDFARNMSLYADYASWNHVPVDKMNDDVWCFPAYSRGSTTDMGISYVRDSKEAIHSILHGKVDLSFESSAAFTTFARFVQLFGIILPSNRIGSSQTHCQRILEQVDETFAQYIPRNYARCLDHIFYTKELPSVAWRAQTFVPWGPEYGICTDHHLLVGFFL